MAFAQFSHQNQFAKISPVFSERINQCTYELVTLSDLGSYLYNNYVVDISVQT